MTSLTAALTGGGGQTTAWIYGVTQTDSGLDSNDIVGETRWPDPTDGHASASEDEDVTVSALGQTVRAPRWRHSATRIAPAAGRLAQILSPSHVRANP
jgi:hypothetical protein